METSCSMFYFFHPNLCHLLHFPALSHTQLPQAIPRSNLTGRLGSCLCESSGTCKGYNKGNKKRESQMWRKKILPIRLQKRNLLGWGGIGAGLWRNVLISDDVNDKEWMFSSNFSGPRAKSAVRPSSLVLPRWKKFYSCFALQGILCSPLPRERALVFFASEGEQDIE